MTNVTTREALAVQATVRDPHRIHIAMRLLGTCTKWAPRKPNWAMSQRALREESCKTVA